MYDVPETDDESSDGEYVDHASPHVNSHKRPRFKGVDSDDDMSIPEQKTNEADDDTLSPVKEPVQENETVEHSESPTTVL